MGKLARDDKGSRMAVPEVNDQEKESGNSSDTFVVVFQKMATDTVADDGESGNDDDCDAGCRWRKMMASNPFSYPLKSVKCYRGG